MKKEVSSDNHKQKQLSMKDGRFIYDIETELRYEKSDAFLCNSSNWVVGTKEFNDSFW